MKIYTEQGSHSQPFSHPLDLNWIYETQKWLTSSESVDGMSPHCLMNSKTSCLEGLKPFPASSMALPPRMIADPTESCSSCTQAHTHTHHVRNQCIRTANQKAQLNTSCFPTVNLGYCYHLSKETKIKYWPGCVWPGSPESSPALKKGNLSPGNVWPTSSLKMPGGTRWRWSSGMTHCLSCTAWCWLRDTVQKIPRGLIRKHCQACMGGIKKNDFSH